ncbi:MAG: glycosyltransferase [Candidatus Ancaeobacter aquaticus]|nr:glycosyltransferase [Candidatus Ancaeobacter aquaticus]
MSALKVSIIIPIKNYNDYLNESVEACLNLLYPNFEIIVLPDDCSGSFKHSDKKQVKIIPTGPMGPSEKRDIGAKKATGEILAFIDDDAYPVGEWLGVAVRNFSDPDVAAVGGPGVTPYSDSLLQQVSGAIYDSWMASGANTYRYRPGKKRLVDDYPSCNFIVRKSVFDEVGGFDSTYYPGEDTVLCLKITKKLKKKIVYEPLALVYHHRRAVFKPHLKQITNYAKHRGYFVKKFPETSMRLSYFIPSMFVCGVVFGWLLFLLNILFLYLYCGIIIVYLLCAIINSQKLNSFRGSILTFIGIVLTNCTYGVFFLKGLCSKKL